MTIGTKPAADLVVDPSLVHALLQEQHPDLAHLVPLKVAEGWDNAIFRLGDELAVRLPRRAASATLIEHEQRWLPQLSPRLPIPVPVPLRVGVPSPMFGWAWSDRPMASWPESPACRLAGPGRNGRSIGAFSSRAPSARAGGRPAQSVARRTARSANRCTAQTSPSARRRRGPSRCAQPVGPRAIGDAVAWTSAVAPRRSSSGQPARERWPPIGRDRFRRSHMRRSSD